MDIMLDHQPAEVDGCNSSQKRAQLWTEYDDKILFKWNSSKTVFLEDEETREVTKQVLVDCNNPIQLQKIISFYDIELSNQRL